MEDKLSSLLTTPTDVGSPHFSFDSAVKSFRCPDSKQELISVPGDTPVSDTKNTVDKNAKFDPFSTPTTPILFTGQASTTIVDYLPFIYEVLAWTNKFRSATYFIFGGALLTGAAYLLYAPPKITGLTALSYFLLSDLLWNFLRSLVSRQYHENCRWMTSSWTRSLINQASFVIRSFATVHDKYLSNQTPKYTVQAIALLWALSFLGKGVGVFPLLCVAYVLAFTLTPAYENNKGVIDTAISTNLANIKSVYDGMSRKSKFGAFTCFVVILCLFPVNNLAIAMFMLAAFGYTLLKPAEVDAIGRNAYTQKVSQNVFNVSTQLSTAMDEYVTKHNLTPTPKSKLH